jgi:uncharacterized protein involved in exopolysaccharide biosynthesis
VTSGTIGDYVQRLADALRQRGIEDTRLLEETREHLIDAVDDGRRRGLSIEEAEREAFERFGLPELVATQALQKEDDLMTRFGIVVDRTWRRKWWIFAPTVVSALVTSAASYYFLPVRYRSESTIHLVPARVSGASQLTDPADSRLQRVSELILSRAHLERIARDFGLGEPGGEQGALADIVVRMRRDVGLHLNPGGGQNGDVRSLRVSYVSSDPTTAMKVAERLTKEIVQETLEEKELQVAATGVFIDSQIEDLRERIIAHERKLALRVQSSPQTVSQTDLLQYDVLQETYKALLIRSEEARIAAQLERRQIGEQFRMVDGPRLPERPVGPTRLGVSTAGTLAGFGVGLALAATRRGTKPRP